MRNRFSLKTVALLLIISLCAAIVPIPAKAQESAPSVVSSEEIQHQRSEELAVIAAEELPEIISYEEAVQN